MVKRELAAVIRYEQHQHAGTILFKQGDPGNCWFIILRGSVNVCIYNKVKLNQSFKFSLFIVFLYLKNNELHFKL